MKKKMRKKINPNKKKNKNKEPKITFEEKFNLYPLDITEIKNQRSQSLPKNNKLILEILNEDNNDENNLTGFTFRNQTINNQRQTFETIQNEKIQHYQKSINSQGDMNNLLKEDLSLDKKKHKYSKSKSKVNLYLRKKPDK